VKAGWPGADDGDGDGDGVRRALGAGDGVGTGGVGMGDRSGAGGRVSGWCRVACWPAGIPDTTPAATAPATVTAANPS